ncbi:MAG: TonB family protein [Cyclobacteriaceae bacterium]
MTDYTNDITRYLRGEMTPAEMHALEKKALSDPFLADALEGAATVGVHDFTSEITAINQRIEEQPRSRVAANEASASRVAGQPSSVAEKPTVHRVTVAGWAMRIAAGLILLVVASFVIWQFTKQSEDTPLALNETSTGSAPDEDHKQGLPAELDPAEEAGGRVDKDEVSRQASTSHADTEQKPSGSLAEKKPDSKTDDESVADLQAAPVLAEAAKAKQQTEDMSATEKDAAKLATVDRPEEEALANDDRKKAAGISRSSVNQNQRVIHGKVTSAEDGSPLPGVNVIIKGTSTGTVTDAGGNYQIESTQPNPSLVYSFIGLQSQEVSAGDRSQVDVQMALDAAQLSEVVVTGYAIRNAEPYTPTVELAHPVTGNREFKKYLESSLRYPQEALDKKVEGRVTVEFFVETNGALTAFTVIRGIGAGCDEELIRLIKEGPRWEPTKRNGAPIRDKARVRLKFEIPKKP